MAGIPPFEGSFDSAQSLLRGQVNGDPPATVHGPHSSQPAYSSAQKIRR